MATPIEAAAEALREGSGVTHPWAMSITPQMLTAALDAVDLPQVVATERFRSIGSLTKPTSTDRRIAEAIRAALLEGASDE